MKTSSVGINVIKHFEKFVPTVYLCPAGIPTIGYGHVVRKGESFVTITETGASILLAEDLISRERDVLALIRYPLAWHQFDALVSFVYNIGSGALAISTLRRQLNSGDILAASLEFPKWCWAGGRKLNGLIRRRKVEQKLFLYGEVEGSTGT